MSDVYNLMLQEHDLSTNDGLRNATYEVMQQVVLSGLYRGGFFKEAAFYGGTCLRIFHHLGRYSEDMDFSLLEQNPNFRFEDYFPAIVEEAKLLGREIVITKKEKHNFSHIESAFLKDNTDVYNLSFRTDKSLKIKIEVDTHPPLGFATEQKLLLLPFSFHTRIFTLPCLYAGKMHALLFRAWKNRIKGRDWYDFEWYVRKGIKLDFAHLQQRAYEFNAIELTREVFLDKLRERLVNADINIVKQDVEPFIINKRDLDIWSNDYFLQLAEMIRFA